MLTSPGVQLEVVGSVVYFIHRCYILRDHHHAFSVGSQHLPFAGMLLFILFGSPLECLQRKMSPLCAYCTHSSILLFSDGLMDMDTLAFSSLNSLMAWLNKLSFPLYSIVDEARIQRNIINSCFSPSFLGCLIYSKEHDMTNYLPLNVLLLLIVTFYNNQLN